MNNCGETDATDPRTWCAPGECRGCDAARILSAHRAMFNDLVAQGVPSGAILPCIAFSTLRTISQLEPERARLIIIHALDRDSLNTMH